MNSSIRSLILLLAVLAGFAQPAFAQQAVNTELPTPAALSDSLANPTISSLGSYSLVFDGAVWRRLTVGTAGTASTQVLTIQGIASMTPILATLSGTNNITNISGTISLPPGASTAANQTTAITALQLIDNLPNTIGSTTSGQSGVLTLGAVTTSAPTYTTAQSAPLSLDTSGALRVSGASGTTQYAEDSAVADGNSLVAIGAIRRDTTPSSSSGAAGDHSALNVDANGRLYVNSVLYTAAGAAIGAMTTTEATHDAALTASTTVGTPEMRRGVTALPTAASANDDAVLAASTLQGQALVVPTAASFGGAESFWHVSTASDNTTNIKSSPGTIYDISIVNTTATLYYVKLYNLASAPTCSSATGFVESIPVPASATGAGIVRTFPVGRAYSTGIAFCIVNAGATTSSGNAAAGVYLSVGYK